MSELDERGTFLSSHLSEMVADNLLTGNILRLKMQIHHFKKENHDIEYIYVLDGNGHHAAHTFDNGVPAGLIEAADIRLRTGNSIKHFVTEKGNISDIASPILQGDAGTIHIGFTDSSFKKHINDITNKLLMGITGVLILGGAIAVVFASVIARPVRRLTEVAEKVGEGNLEQSAPVTTNDEIGQLGRVFNGMLESLRHTTVSRDYLDNVINSMTDIVVVIDRDFTIRSINYAATRLLGYSSEELVGTNFTPLCEDREMFIHNAGILLEEGAVSNIKSTFISKSRGMIPMLFSGAIIKDNSDHAESIVIVGRDISDIRKANEDLKQSYDFIATVINSINDGLLIINVDDFTIAGTNRTFLEEGGFDISEVIGRKCHEVTHMLSNPCAAPDDMCPLMETRATGKHANAEHIHYSKNGDKHYIEVSTSPIFDKTGKLTQVVHVARDITEKKSTEAEIIAERDRAQNYLDVAGVMLVAIDAEQKVTLINKKGCEILGQKENEIIGKNWIDTYISESVRSEVREVFNRLMAGDIEADEYYENHILSSDGSEKIIAWRNTVLKDTSGNIAGTLSSGENITKRKQAEKALQQNQSELIAKHEELNELFKRVEIANIERQKTMDSMGDMIILTDYEGTVKRINKAVIQFARKSYDSIIGTNWESFISDHNLQATTLYEGSTELMHPPSGKWFELKAYPYEDVDLHMSGNVITIHETTEIKKISAELEHHHRISNEHRLKLQAALDQISMLMQNVSDKTDTTIRLSNKRLKKCYEVKNCKKEDCACYGKEAMRCWQVAGTYCGGKIQGSFAQKYDNCSGCEVFKEATSDSIYQIGEHFNNMMHVLETKNRELEAAYSELKNTQAQILQREKMASIGQLAAGVAHEINNPTGFIMSNLGTLGKYADKLTTFIEAQTKVIESLSAGEYPDELKETRKKLKLDYILEDLGMLINESLDGADRIKKIVQNLKSFSRLDEAEFKPSDINECIESTLNIVWNELKYKATVEKDYGKIPMIKCFPQQLNQVFMNLLVNGAHAIESQGTIKIKTWNGDGALHISISDTGSGIPEDKIKRIFEPFFTTKPVGKGTGLGLSITYDIVKKHNGDIMVSSEVGKGTEFTITLPFDEGDSENDE